MVKSGFREILVEWQPNEGTLWTVAAMIGKSLRRWSRRLASRLERAKRCSGRTMFFGDSLPELRTACSGLPNSGLHDLIDHRTVDQCQPFVAAEVREGQFVLV